MKRIASLDSLRGIAALVVVAGHGAAVYPGFLETMRVLPVLPLPLAGAVAVQLFFVLSGLVLYLTFAAVDRFAYRPYLTKRILRIYPPLVAAVIGSALLGVALGPPAAAGYSRWFGSGTWSVPPSPLLVAGHLLLLDTPRFQTLDPVIWSLVHEMRMSIVFPLIAVAVRRRTAAGSAVALGGALLLALAARRLSFGHAEGSWPVDVFATLQYTFLFTAGATIGAQGERVRDALRARPAAWLPVLIAALALASIQPRWAAGLPTGLGAIGLVALCYASVPVSHALDRAPLRWLGRVSYALYLVHLPVLYAVMATMPAGIALPIRLLIAGLASLVVAELLHRAVERPAITLGRRMSGRVPLTGRVAHARS